MCRRTEYSYVMWCKAPGNSFNLTGLPSSADHRRGYERVAYVNNDHPVHFGDIFLVIIDINMARSLLFPSTEETAILRHLPKETSLNKEAVKTLYDRPLIFSPLSANHPTTIPKKWIYLKFNSKIQDGGQEPLRRIDACLEPTAAAAQFGNAWPPSSPLYHTHWISAPLNLQ